LTDCNLVKKVLKQKAFHKNILSNLPKVYKYYYYGRN
jgi:hypothetical protein